jgi:hypothetical protein
MKESILENASQGDFFQSPWTLRLYLDGRLNDDLRAYVLSRQTYDPSVSGTSAPGIGSQDLVRSSSTLDELKIQFNLSKKVFWTLGLQKIKWGSGRFWNPTDFLNTTARDYFYGVDLRQGLPLLKAHLPLGSSNFYLIALENSGNQLKQIQLALRSEFAFDFGEVTASFLSPRSSSAWLGIDGSMGLGDFDVNMEFAYRGSDVKSAVLGFSYDWKYNDNDVANFGIEGFYQESGTRQVSDYLTLLATDRFIPFYVGQYYVMGVINLSKPASWNDSVVTSYYVRNFSDDSSYLRCMYTYTGYKDLDLSLAIGQRFGDASSEMKLGGQSTDLNALAKLQF